MKTVPVTTTTTTSTTTTTTEFDPFKYSGQEVNDGSQWWSVANPLVDLCTLFKLTLNTTFIQVCQYVEASGSLDWNNSPYSKYGITDNNSPFIMVEACPQQAHYYATAEAYISWYDLHYKSKLLHPLLHCREYISVSNNY